MPKPGDMLKRRDPRHGARQSGLHARSGPASACSRTGCAARSSASRPRWSRSRTAWCTGTSTLKLPVRPMIGVIGVAPVHGAVLTVDNGTHGGNLDVQEITTGNNDDAARQRGGRPSVSRRLPRDPGRRRGQRHGRDRDRGNAHGEGHPVQKAPSRLNYPRIETPTHICTLGCAKPAGGRDAASPSRR